MKVLVPGLLFVVLATSTAFAQMLPKRQTADTFKFTIADKTPEHPNFGVGHTQGFLVNGSQGDTLVILRNQDYALDYRGLDNWALIYTIPIGGTMGDYFDEVVRDGPGGNQKVLRVTDRDPDTLYYASQSFPWMGSTIIIVDSLTTSVDASRTVVTYASSTVYPNPFYDRATIAVSTNHTGLARLEVVDLSGRTVRTQQQSFGGSPDTEVHFDRGDLPAGTYIYRLVSVGGNEQPMTSGTLQIR